VAPGFCIALKPDLAWEAYTTLVLTRLARNCAGPSESNVSLEGYLPESVEHAQLTCAGKPQGSSAAATLHGALFQVRPLSVAQLTPISLEPDNDWLAQSHDKARHPSIALPLPQHGLGLR
jgi:hypothetical protein